MEVVRYIASIWNLEVETELTTTTHAFSFTFQLLTTVTVDELATPGLRSIFNFITPDQQLGKVDIHLIFCW